MRNRLRWLVELALVTSVVVAVSVAAIGIAVAFSPAAAPPPSLPASLTLTGPPPAEVSPPVDFEVAPSPSIDLTEHDPVTSPEGSGAGSAVEGGSGDDSADGTPGALDEDSPQDAAEDAEDAAEDAEDAEDAVDDALDE